MPWLLAASSTRNGKRPLPAIRPYLLGDATFGSLDELEQDFNLRCRATLPNRLNGLCRIQLGLQQEPKRGFDARDLVRRETLSLQTDGIRPECFGVPLTDRLRIRQNIPGDDGVSPDIGMGPDAAELVNTRIGSDRGVVLDRHVARQRRGIGHDDVVADRAVVRDMRPDHQKVAVSDAGLAAAASGSAVNIDVLAKRVARTDGQKSFLVVKLQILWGNANHTEGKEAVVAVDCRGSF